MLITAICLKLFYSKNREYAWHIHPTHWRKHRQKQSRTQERTHNQPCLNHQLLGMFLDQTWKEWRNQLGRCKAQAPLEASAKCILQRKAYQIGEILHCTGDQLSEALCENTRISFPGSKATFLIFTTQIIGIQFGHWYFQDKKKSKAFIYLSLRHRCLDRGMEQGVHPWWEKRKGSSCCTIFLLAFYPLSWRSVDRLWTLCTVKTKYILESIFSAPFSTWKTPFVQQSSQSGRLSWAR